MPRLPIRTALPAVACAVALIPAAGCGDSGGGGGGGASSPNAQPATPSAQVRAAASPRIGEFPAARGRTLRQVAEELRGGPELGQATHLYEPGRARLAFGVVGRDGGFLYGATAVYVARRPDAPARGPFLAPADSLQVRPPFRSRTSASDAGDVEAIYHATIDLPAPGRWFVLSATRAGTQLLGATTAIEVRRQHAIPHVGEPAPRIATPTLASAGGDAASIDTRDPPDDMHEVSLRDVLGKQPVALLFATPALCQSRVCGPVTDVAAQLHAAYGDEVAFIHNEVYADNDPNKGLRPQMKAFGLRTEPWLFTIDRHGRIAARLEGAFGFGEFRAAIEAARR
jgi:hypothetical protein